LYSHIKIYSGKYNAPHNHTNLESTLSLVANKTHENEDTPNASTNRHQNGPQIEEKNKGKMYIENEPTEEGI